MSNLATVLIELLCHITVEPEGGLDPDETADLQINAWQTLIHDLSDSEKAVVKIAAEAKLRSLEGIAAKTPEQEQVEAILDAYVRDELM